jgi:hypothetical protein
MVGLRTERSSLPSRTQPSKLAPQWLSYLNNTTTKLQHGSAAPVPRAPGLLLWQPGRYATQTRARFR